MDLSSSVPARIHCIVARSVEGAGDSRMLNLKFPRYLRAGLNISHSIDKRIDGF